MDTSPTDGLRLAKRVAELAQCSRREAELLIESGAVRIDGTLCHLPQTRVHPAQQISIQANARPLPIVPVTLLLHKPAGVDAAAALLRPDNRLDAAHTPPVLPRHLVHQRCVAPLEADASGLVVFTQVHGIARRLLEDAAFMEHEVMVDVTGNVPPEICAQFAAGAARVSISGQTPGQTRLRFALKGLQPGQITQWCENAGLRVVAMKRIRIGRLPLAGLPEGRWRYLQAHERF